MLRVMIENPVGLKGARCGLCRTTFTMTDDTCRCPSCGATRRWTCTEQDDVASWRLEWVPKAETAAHP